jgi:hypothetical protein
VVEVVRINTHVEYKRTLNQEWAATASVAQLADGFIQTLIDYNAGGGSATDLREVGYDDHVTQPFVDRVKENILAGDMVELMSRDCPIRLRKPYNKARFYSKRYRQNLAKLFEEYLKEIGFAEA